MVNRHDTQVEYTRRAVKARVMFNLHHLLVGDFQKEGTFVIIPCLTVQLLNEQFQLNIGNVYSLDRYDLATRGRASTNRWEL